MGGIAALFGEMFKSNYELSFKFRKLNLGKTRLAFSPPNPSHAGNDIDFFHFIQFTDFVINLFKIQTEIKKFTTI